jgi:hypothetical protein
MRTINDLLEEGVQINSKQNGIKLNIGSDVRNSISKYVGTQHLLSPFEYIEEEIDFAKYELMPSIRSALGKQFQCEYLGHVPGEGNTREFILGIRTEMDVWEALEEVNTSVEKHLIGEQFYLGWRFTKYSTEEMHPNYFRILRNRLFD